MACGARGQASNPPRTVPRLNAITVETVSSPIVHGMETRMMSSTFVGYSMSE